MEWSARPRHEGPDLSLSNDGKRAGYCNPLLITEETLS
jgi:hypothetical protein